MSLKQQYECLEKDSTWFKSIAFMAYFQHCAKYMPISQKTALGSIYLLQTRAPVFWR